MTTVITRGCGLPEAADSAIQIRGHMNLGTLET